MDFNARAAASA